MASSPVTVDEGEAKGDGEGKGDGEATAKPFEACKLTTWKSIISVRVMPSKLTATWCHFPSDRLAAEQPDVGS